MVRKVELVPVTMFILVTSTGVSTASSDFSFMNSQVEMIKKFEGVRYHTIPMSMVEGTGCKSFTSYIYATRRAFYLTTPFFEGLLFSKKRGNYSADVFLGGDKCNLSMSISKFERENGLDKPLSLFDSSTLIKSLSNHLDADLEKASREERGTVTDTSSQMRQQALHAGTIVGIDERGAKVDLNRGDPNRDGIGDTGVVFDTKDVEKEYEGMLYCSIASCSIYLTNAEKFDIKGFYDDGGKEIGMDVVGDGSRLHILFNRHSSY